MKQIRKILCCVLVLCVLLSVMPMEASAAGYANGCTLCGSGNCTFSDSHPAHRIYGNTRYQTSFAIADALKKEMGISKFPNIIIASGTNFADALSGSYLAIVKNAPILLSSGSNGADLRSYVQNNLQWGGTVYILGGTAAVPSSIENALSGFYCKRIWGQDRYETNLAILREAGVYGTYSDLLVCTGTNFADSLSASAAGRPMLMVKGSLNQNQTNFLSSRSGNIYIIGGTAAVSSQMERTLGSYGNMYRMAGNNRYETSLLVAQTFRPIAEKAVVAYAQNFPDGLCGGPLAYRLGGPMILTQTNKASTAAAYTTSSRIKQGYVLGGSGLISDDAARSIFPNKGGTSGPSNGRPEYRLGTNKDLEGNPYVILIFMDDDESYWTDEAYSSAWQNTIAPGLQFLEEWAGRWGVSLDFTEGVYRTENNRVVRYHGTVANIDEASYSKDVLEQAAKSIGFSSAKEMHQHLKNYSGCEEVICMVLLNKDGRSYSLNDEIDDGYEYLEYCVVYSCGTGYKYEATPSTVAHELLHAYGAMDYYDPYGDYPNRKVLAERLFYDDIMLRTYYDPSYNTVGSYTAYSVGWSDYFPPECDCPEWWS